MSCWSVKRKEQAFKFDVAVYKHSLIIIIIYHGLNDGDISLTLDISKNLNTCISCKTYQNFFYIIINTAINNKDNNNTNL